jgi:hypothetical protein
MALSIAVMCYMKHQGSWGMSRGLSIIHARLCAVVSVLQVTTGGLLQGLSDDALAVQQGLSEKVRRAVTAAASATLYCNNACQPLHKLPLTRMPSSMTLQTT